jgi:hypothetical protein
MNVRTLVNLFVCRYGNDAPYNLIFYQIKEAIFKSILYLGSHNWKVWEKFF